MATKSSTAPLVVIVGETASGKSQLAIDCAERWNGELICADSRTVYKYMDVGTAKPTRGEQERVKHHLLDLVEPDQRYTAAEFQKATQSCIDDITSRGKLAIMIGGSGLYVDSVIFEYKFRPKSDKQADTKLQDKTVQELYEIAQGRGLEPVSSTNKRYLLRLIESDQKPPQDRHSLRANTLVVGLSLNRTVLRSRIIQRVDNMFRHGLRREVTGLLERYSWDDPGMTGIGYREFKPYYEGEISLSKVKQKVIYSTLQFAKRQRTWFKRNQYITWVSSNDEAVSTIDTFVSDIVKHA